MDDNQKQDWWPDLDAKASSSEPVVSDTPVPEPASIPSESNDSTPTPESTIDVPNPDTQPLNETPNAGESEEPNPYIQYPWNQIPRNQANQQNGNEQNPYGYQQNPYQNNPYQQNPFQQNPYQQNAYGRPQHQQRAANPFATAAMVMGIVSLVVTCCGGSFIFGALGIIFAMLSRKEKKLETQAKTGLILSIIGSVAGIALIIASFVMMQTPEYQDIMEEYQRFYNEYEEDGDEYQDFEEFDFDDFDEFYFNQGDSNTISEDSL